MTPTLPPIAGRLLLAFEGSAPPPDLPSAPVAGFTIFRDHNVESAAQLRSLADALHARSDDGLPLLICIDQEGGQFLGLGDIGTPFPGNMALGAAGSPELAREVAMATGQELRAMGINVNYAPVADLTTNPNNPSLGIRSFGDDPSTVGSMVAATVTGLRAAGIAATVKHFPGKGGATVDSHFGLPVLDNSRQRLEEIELVPFRSGLAAGAELVMTGHFALPAITGRHDLPATLSHDVLVDLLRGDLGFDGVVVSDAFNMQAISQGPAQVIDAVVALNSGVDLLLLTHESEMRTQLPDALEHAAARGLLTAEDHRAASARVHALRNHLATFDEPTPDIVRSSAHMDLARRAAAGAVTLVRNEADVVPLRLNETDRVLAVMPQPENLTPADTSASVHPELGAALGRHHGRVDELIMSHTPDHGEISAVAASAAGYDVVVVGTIAASMNPAQAQLVSALVEASTNLVTVALRTPWDLTVYPGAKTHLCTYGILRPSLDALADALFGVKPAPGRLPTPIEGLYSRGHGLSE